MFKLVCYLENILAKNYSAKNLREISYHKVYNICYPPNSVTDNVEKFSPTESLVSNDAISLLPSNELLLADFYTTRHLLEKNLVEMVTVDFNLMAEFMLFIDESKRQPPINFVTKKKENFYECVPINAAETRFQNILSKIIDTGYVKNTRMGVQTKSVFGEELTFDLSNYNFPLSTLRKQPLRHIFMELKWFLSGSTDANVLNNSGVNVWLPNSSREFLDNRGLQHLRVGDIGAGYGHQYRHFGAEYKGCDVNYQGQGIDQVEYCLKELAEDPDTRRALISIWNPADLNKMALPPCLWSFQFNSRTTSKTVHLSLKMNQRSSDIMLAGAWNIATGALLLKMFCHILTNRTGRLYAPEKLIWSLGDVHIYSNQLEVAEEIVARDTKPYPLLQINGNQREISEINFEDLVLIGYNPSSKIPVKFNV